MAVPECALVTGVLFCLAFAGPVISPTLVPFVIMGYLLGAFIGSMDVAMNAHGIAVERALKRPIMSMLHGGFSVGGMVGAFLGAWAMKHMGEFTHIALAGAACLILLFISVQFLLPRSIDKGLSDTHFGWPTKATIGLGLLCFLALMAEGSVLDWSAIYFTAEFKVDAGTAGLGYAFFSGGMAASRFTGDWLRQKFGAVHMVVASALLTAVSIALAVRRFVVFNGSCGFHLCRNWHRQCGTRIVCRRWKTGARCAGARHRRRHHPWLCGLPRRPASDRLCRRSYQPWPRLLAGRFVSPCHRRVRQHGPGRRHLLTGRI